jgi:hypothetical protein
VAAYEEHPAIVDFLLQKNARIDLVTNEKLRASLEERKKTIQSKLMPFN